MTVGYLGKKYYSQHLRRDRKFASNCKQSAHSKFGPVSCRSVRGVHTASKIWFLLIFIYSVHSTSNSVSAPFALLCLRTSINSVFKHTFIIKKWNGKAPLNPVLITVSLGPIKHYLVYNNGTSGFLHNTGAYPVRVRDILLLSTIISYLKRHNQCLVCAQSSWLEQSLTVIGAWLLYSRFPKVCF